MSNVFKNAFMSPEEFKDENLLIDSNSLVDVKIAAHEELMEKRRKKKSKDASQFELLNEMETEEGRQLSEEELEALLQEQEAQKLEADNIINDANEQAQQILADAQAQVQAMLDDANAQSQEIIDSAGGQIEAMKKQAIEEGKKQGYDLGQAMGMADMAKAKDELALEDQRREEEYKVKCEAIEGQMVEVICDVIEKVFMIQFGDKKEILLHLIENAVTNIESSREFQVKVNDKSFEFLQNNKSVIQEKVGTDVQLDIILDPLLEDGDCILETDGGVFDCSLGVQLSNLIKDIKSLSI